MTVLGHVEAELRVFEWTLCNHLISFRGLNFNDYSEYATSLERGNLDLSNSILIIVGQLGKIS